jgi:hypothetical protein
LFAQFLFYSPNHSHFYLTVSSHPYTISDLFSSQFHVLDIDNQLCSTRFIIIIIIIIGIVIVAVAVAMAVDSIW